MTISCPALSLCIVLLLCRTLNAGAPSFGQPAAAFLFGPSALLADPVRARMYAAVPATGSVTVIDTTTLSVLAAVPIGDNPQGLAISPDGNTLYVANEGSATAAIGVLDLNSLETRSPIALPQAPRSVAAGLAGRLYASGDVPGSGVFQVDTATGSILPNVTRRDDYASLLFLSPDFRTLYVAGDDVRSYDVSTPTTAPLLNDDVGGSLVGGDFTALSHDGHLIAHSVPTDEEAINPRGIYAATFDLGDPLAVLELGSRGDPDAMAFSADDRFFYVAEYGLGQSLAEYDLNSFALITEVPLPPLATKPTSTFLTAMAEDHTGSYLFVSEDSPPDALAVVYTGRGTAAPPNPPTTVSITATPLILSLSTSTTGKFKLTRAGGDLSQPLTVFYTVKGNAKSADYFLLKGGASDGTLPGVVTFKPGQQSTNIKVEALNSGGNTGVPSLVLKLKLLAGAVYQVGSAKSATIQIAR